MRCTANQAITLWLQSTLLAGRVAGEQCPKQDGHMVNAALERISY